jgi:hypothetical protein
MAKICKDGRVWGQNNKEAGDHLKVNFNREYWQNYFQDTIVNLN